MLTLSARVLLARTVAISATADSLATITDDLRIGMRKADDGCQASQDLLWVGFCFDLVGFFGGSR